MDKMEQRKRLLSLIACAVLFVVAFAVHFFSEKSSQPTETVQHKGGVCISEIMSNNKTYPDNTGKVLDYIEVSNFTDKTVDISNYKLSDDETTIGYTFPQGTVLPPYGSAVCWCDSQGGDTYAQFGISKDGGETIYLYNSANVIIDQKSVPPLGENTPYILQSDGSWVAGGPASPGFENTEDGNAQWLDSIDYKAPSVKISEVQTTARYTHLDTAGTVCDWVELYNPGKKDVVLDGAYLSNDPAEPLKWQIPSLTIEAGGYALIRCSGLDAKFSLSSDGCQVILTGLYGNLLSALEVPALERDTTWSMDSDGTYAVSERPTPGFENNDDGYAQWLRAIGSMDYPVIISEVQTSNRSAILSEAGELCDWIELYNPSREAAVLDGCFLSDDETNLFKWQISELTLNPGEYAVIPCTGKNGNSTEASFAMSKSGCTVVLSGPVGNRITQVTCPSMNEDRSWQWVGEDAYAETEYFSPGYENTQEGHEAYRATQEILGALAISEVMASNDRYMLQRDGEYHDWIELQNVSDEVIDLSEYAISDSSSNLQLFQLPQKELKPGEMVIVICSGNTELTGSYIHAPFTLNRDECWVYVSHLERGISDYLRIAGVPLQGSGGRMDGQNGLFYFSTPTPGSQNIGGAAEITEDPFVETPDGVYNDVTDVRVALSGEGQIRYTLDGSEPTMYSKLYTEPLVLTKTTVVRAKSYSEGKLPSQVVTASFIINENHTLPVVSIAASPSGLFGSEGIYTRYFWNHEIPCNLTLYEGDGGFSVDCGLKLYGHTGLELPKKSFKVNFRSQYGESVLNYPVYGEDGPFLYDSLCLRAGQDYPQAIFREELFTSLCREMSDSVLTQRSKHCILYVNGEYFGIYSMKEAFNELYYAQNRDVREESVEIVQAPVDYDTDLHAFFRFLDGADMTLDENYAYACQMFDMDSVIDWIIIQGYSTNGDVQQNLRYFRSTDDGNRYSMAFYDLDWAFYYHYPFMDVLSDTRNYWQHLMLTTNLMENPTFRQKFLARLSECMETTLSNENVLARIEYYYELLAPEVPRERQRWDSTYDLWEWDVNYLRNFVAKYDNLGEIVNRLKRYIGLTEEEAEIYFGKWNQN